jgi:hypothetical protein
MLTSRSPWFAATNRGVAGVSGIAEAFIINRVKGRTRQNIRQRKTNPGLFIARELYICEQTARALTRVKE